MSGINVKRFVDIDIKSTVRRTILGTRDTVVLFTSDGTEGTSRLITSLSEANEYYSDAPTTKAYLNVFFNNGGLNCLVIENKTIDENLAEDIAALDNDKIVIAFADDGDAYDTIKAIAVEREAESSVYGINEKILLARTTTAAQSDNVKNFAVKYSNVLGAEMTIAAYLCQVNVYNTDSIFDYAFTKENLTEESLTDANFETITTNNMNVDVFLANAVRNCGGNLKDGSDITNSYVRIILHQTLTERLLDLLVQKIKGSVGLSQIYSVIAQELEQYRTAGYLSTDKIWDNDSLVIQYNQKNYTIIEEGTPLITGYFIKILPISSLTEIDKAQKKVPPIYVIIADQYGIRHITISGEVI